MLKPQKPNKPSGPGSGNTNKEYQYCTSAIDPTPEDKLWYKWDWGDGTITSWDGPYTSGEQCCETHIWAIPADYNVKVQVKNIYQTSEWSTPLKVTVKTNPPDLPIIEGPTRVIAGQEYTYSFTLNDYDEDDIEFIVDWGHGSYTEWYGPYKSGSNINIKHKWPDLPKIKEYKVSAKAKDIYNAESEWSNGLIIYTPRNRNFAGLPIFNVLSRLFEKFPILEIIFFKINKINLEK